MFRKSWKRISLSLGILFLTTISGICYLSCDSMRKSKEPVKIYRVTEPMKKDTSTDTAKNDTHSNSNYQKGSGAVDTYPSPKSGASGATPSLDPSTTSKESDQQGSDLKTSQHNNEKLAKEEVEREKAEFLAKRREAQARSRERREKIEKAREQYNRSKKKLEQRYYELADKLNALSVEEQQAYFEDYRNQQPAAKEFIRSTFFEKARTEAEAQGYSEQMEVILSQMEQRLLGTTDEQRVNQHIDKLREYGFEPKF